mgnify:CR=1 FL=1
MVWFHISTTFFALFIGATPIVGILWNIFRRFTVSLSPHSLPLIQPHLVSYHCNELTVGGLAAQVVDGVAEVAVEGVHIAPVPCHLDGVADGALHPAGGGAVFLGNFRVQTLGHGVDILRFVHGEQDGIPQELVTLDVGGDGIRVGNKSKSKSYYLLV